MEIKITCSGSCEYSLEELQPFQGTLKNLSVENYEKMKEGILKNGFCFPFNVWDRQNNVKKTPDVIGGHQRLRTLKKMREDGILLPEKFPCVSIDAENEKLAKKLVLADSSQFGKINNESLYEYMNAIDLSFDDLQSNFDFDAINFDSFEKNFFTDEVVKDETGAEDDETLENNVICPSCGVHFHAPKK